jgi:hypothetical protein
MSRRCDWDDTPNDYRDAGDHLPATERRESSHVCRHCAADYDAWAAEDARPDWDGYDGPQYADTMSGGVVCLSC